MGDLELFRQPAVNTDFLRVFNRLCVALRETQDDSGATQQVYFEALGGLPITALEEGAGALMKEPGRKWFPTTAEWRAAATKAQEQAFRAAVQPAPADVHGVFVCLDCHDTGWLFGPGGDAMTCPGDRRCGRRQKHGPHTYTQACGCRASNVNFQRRAHFGAGR